MKDKKAKKMIFISIIILPIQNIVTAENIFDPCHHYILCKLQALISGLENAQDSTNGLIRNLLNNLCHGVFNPVQLYIK